MIVINLLPEELRPIKRTPLPHLLSLVVLVLAIAGMVVMFGVKAAEIGGKKQELAKAQTALDELQPIVDEYEELNRKKQQLDRKISVIQEITKDRIIWSERLHQLATLTPDNFWYKTIQETFRNATVERVMEDEKGQPVIDPKTKKPKTVKDRVRLPVLVISGYVAPDENGLDDINPLSFNTNEDPEFSKLFVLERPGVTLEEFNGKRIRGFEFEYRIEPGDES